MSSLKELGQKQLPDFKNTAFYKTLIEEKRLPFFREMVTIQTSPSSSLSIISGASSSFTLGARFYECHIPDVPMEAGDIFQRDNDLQERLTYEIVDQKRAVKGKATRYVLSKDEYHKAVEIYNNVITAKPSPSGK